VLEDPDDAVTKLIGATYHKAQISRVCTDSRDGLQAVIEFDQPSLSNVQEYLMETNSIHFAQLFGDDEGFVEVRGRRFGIVENWLRGEGSKLSRFRPRCRAVINSLLRRYVSYGASSSTRPLGQGEDYSPY
jgi:hypothetical protein